MAQVLEFLRTLFSPLEPSVSLLFTQFGFWVFFLAAYILFALTARRTRLRNVFLLLVSLYFYFRCGGLSIVILAAVIFSDYLLGLCIGKARRKGWKRFFVAVSLIIDLALLCWFKYAGFLTGAIGSFLGKDLTMPAFLSSTDALVMPLGISFFLFRNISYIIDVYRGDVQPVRNILDFGLYVSFFPSIVSGPITKASEFIPQLHEPFSLSREEFGLAVWAILCGLTKKVILGDYIATNFIDRVFSNPLLYSGFENLAAAAGYSLQLYADFSGYTDIAIGLAALMGFRLSPNFDAPYKATDPQNFWKRWHISLSSWLQRYLYIPLGGNRNVSFGTFFWLLLLAGALVLLSESAVVAAAAVAILAIIGLEALLFPKRGKAIASNLNGMVTMLLGGLWHGANWNFLIWGGLNGLGIAAFKDWKAMPWWLRFVLALILGGAAVAGRMYLPSPAMNVASVVALAFAAVTAIRFIYHLTGAKKEFAGLARCWSVLQTFCFITLAWMFFRAGIGASESTTGLDTVRNMIHQIGGDWNIGLLPQVLESGWRVFAVIAAGLILHWLPEKFKSGTARCFARMPLPLMLVVSLAVIFIVYQFMSSGVQPFIYLQF